MYLPESQETTAGGITVRYVAYGNPESNIRDALFHGISVKETMWGRVPEILADLGHFVVAFGRPEGRHAPIVPTLDAFARAEMPAVHTIMGDRKYNAVGLSWGGLFVQALALQDPRAVEHLVVAGAPLFSPTPPGVPDPQAMVAITSSHRSRDAMTRIYGGDFSRDPALQDEFHELIEREIDDIEHGRQLFAAMASGHLVMWKMWQRMIGQDPRTLVLAGTDDPIVPFSAAARSARAMGATLIPMVDGGHGFILTRPEESARLIDDFVNDRLAVDAVAVH